MLPLAINPLQSTTILPGLFFYLCTNTIVYYEATQKVLYLVHNFKFNLHMISSLAAVVVQWESVGLAFCSAPA